MRDQKELARECLEVEQSGGSVLEFLKGKGHISPRATWIRLQMNELGRKDAELTDGKTAKMEKDKRCRNLTAEMKNKAVEMAISGVDPRPYLGRDCGMLDPEAAWSRIRTGLKKTDSERFMQLPKRMPRSSGWGTNSGMFNGKKKVDKGMPKQETPTVKIDGALKIETPEGNRVEVVEMPEKKITKPLNYDGFEVTAIRDGDVGEFYYDRKFETIDWRTLGGDEVSMGPAFWKIFYEKLPKIMAVLGVEL